MINGHSGRRHHVRQVYVIPISCWLRILTLLFGFVATGWGSSALAQTAASAGPALEEVIVTGTRIAVPNAVSTSPIQVISAESIATTGKTDISDVITQLPQNFNNGLGQDLGNTSSGLTTAGGIATA